MPQIFYDRSNAAGGGAFFDRSNNADGAAGLASGSIGTAVASAIAATVAAYATVTFVDPISTGPGSLGYSSNFTGTPAAGDIVRYPTTNGFQVHSDGGVSALVNTGAYACFYTALDGSFTDEPFTVNLSGVAQVFADIAVATTSPPTATAVGFRAGVASAAIGTVTTAALAATADARTVATGAIGTATSSPPAGTGSAPTFVANASASGVTVISVAPKATATGGALAIAQLPTALAIAPEGLANEEGRAEAFGDIGTAVASPPDVKARAQWGVVHSPGKIWTLVS